MNKSVVVWPAICDLLFSLHTHGDVALQGYVAYDDAREGKLPGVLIVHAWRRLALKHPVLPRALHSDTWRGHDCRAQVMHLLDHLPRPAFTDM